MKIGRHKFHINLDNISKADGDILKDNNCIRRYSNNENYDVVQVILEMEKKLKRTTTNIRISIDPEDNQIKPLKVIRDNYSLIKWNCSFCKTSIKSNMNSMKPENFCCSKCTKYYNVKHSSQAVVDNMIRFVEHCKNLLQTDQNNFIKYIKKNK